MSWENDNYPRYFVKDYHRDCTGTKLEDLVMNYAIDQFLHCIIYERDFKDLVPHLEAYREKKRAENKRLAPIVIELDKRDFHAGLRWLRIGKHHLVLQRVRDEIQGIDPLFPNAEKTH